MAKTSTGLILSCQSGVWSGNAMFNKGYACKKITVGLAEGLNTSRVPLFITATRLDGYSNSGIYAYVNNILIARSANSNSDTTGGTVDSLSIIVPPNMLWALTSSSH